MSREKVVSDLILWLDRTLDKSMRSVYISCEKITPVDIGILAEFCMFGR